MGSEGSTRGEGCGCRIETDPRRAGARVRHGVSTAAASPATSRDPRRRHTYRARRHGLSAPVVCPGVTLPVGAHVMGSRR